MDSTRKGAMADHAPQWEPIFQKLEDLQGNDLLAAVQAFVSITDRELDAFSRLRRSAEGRAVPLPGAFSGTDHDVTLLALGFARGEVSALAVPYARRSTA
jgi:hypothetical protein